MNGGIAYHLKQIMTNENLNLTQTAKLIGISVSSLRKVLKDTPLSQPIMFKINRFIDEHRESAATPDIHSMPKPAFTITQSSEHQPGNQPTEVIEPAATAKANRRQQQPKRQATKPAAEKRSEGKQAQKNQAQGKAHKEQPAKTNNGQSTKAKTQASQAKPAKGQATRQKANAKSTTNSQSAGKRGQAKAKSTGKRNQANAAAASTAQQATHQANGTRGRRQTRRRNDEAKRDATSQSASQSASSASASQSVSQSVSQSQSTSQSSRNQHSATAAINAVASAALTPASESTSTRPKAVETTLQLFIDESFKHGNGYNRNMYIGVTAINPDDGHALDKFSQTLYPFGWQPGDEVKARGKDQRQVATLLHDATSSGSANFVVYSPLSDAGNFSMGFGVLYPYLAAILRILDTYDQVPDKVRIVLDKRNEIEGEQLGIAARILNSYLKSASGKNVIFMLRTADSKEELGLQFSDFVAHSALAFDTTELAGFGITRLADVGSALGDELMMYSMIGLQKYLLDDHAELHSANAYRNPLLQAADRLFRLSSKAVGLTDVPAETLAQAKLVVNQLLQIAPSSVSGGINNMPFQNWFDMVARAAAFLHYTDESLPNFSPDPDAMQIANDALNNIANLLASAK